MSRISDGFEDHWSINGSWFAYDGHSSEVRLSEGFRENARGAPFDALPRGLARINGGVRWSNGSLVPWRAYSQLLAVVCARCEVAKTLHDEENTRTTHYLMIKIVAAMKQMNILGSDV